MTFNDAIKKACLLGEFAQDNYRREEYAALADQAQKIIASLGDKISRVFTIEKTSDDAEVYFLPDECTRVWRVERSDSADPICYRIAGNQITVKGKCVCDIFYYAQPTDITADTPNEYEFEIPKRAQFTVPYYMVYHLCKSENTTIAQAALTEWNKYLALFTESTRAVEKNIINYY